MKVVLIVLYAGMVACTVVQPDLAAEGSKAKEGVLHSFGSAGDGLEPQASLIDVKKTLYGTTPFGGASEQGTVFALDRKSGAERVLYSFCSQSGCTDGQQPYAGLIDVVGTLYGSAVGGGESQGGIVFSLDPKTGTEKVIYSFCSQFMCTDGKFPDASLIDIKGTLYSATTSGGSYDGGTVFAVNVNTRAETVLYSFCSQQQCADGDEPTGNLIDVKGTLYGITTLGGNGCSGYGCGTVFSLDPNTGVETVIYAFCSDQNCTDGAGPYDSLIDVKGTLYGITSGGGANCTAAGGCGTVFAVNPDTGAEKVLYSFCSQQNCTDGWSPFASPLYVNGALYGTTYFGGGTGCYNNQGCGVVFKLNPNTGAEKVLYSFCSQQNCTDGGRPFASLIDVRGTLYGTTYLGGTNDAGTAFALKP